jgi:hypothetical protein
MSSLQVLKGFISQALAEELHAYFPKDAERIFSYYFASEKIRLFFGTNVLQHLPCVRQSPFSS